MCDYFSHNDIPTMNTPATTTSLESLNLVAIISTTLAGLDFVAASLIF